MIVNPTPENLDYAASLLRDGKLVAFPTETVYGLGASIFRPDAIRRIFEVKGRPSNNPLIVHFAERYQLEEIADLSRPELALTVARLSEMWPGPLSLVLPRARGIGDEITAGRDSVAVRMPSHQVALALLRLAGPLAAPSANPSSYVSPTTARHVEDSLGTRIELVIDGGPCEVGVESSIVSLLGERPVLLRHGGVPPERLLIALPDLIMASAEGGSTPLAPGMLKEHYSPTTRLALRGQVDLARLPARCGLIAFSAPGSEVKRFESVEELSRSGDLNEVASKLFSALREQDKLGLDLIVVDVCPEEGLGWAIMDRLRRASARFDI